MFDFYLFCITFLHCDFAFVFFGGLFLSTHFCVGFLFLILYRSRLRPASASSSAPSLSPGDIGLRFAWQAWYRWSPGAPRHFAWHGNMDLPFAWQA
jgi:hypothetical protein